MRCGRVSQLLPPRLQMFQLSMARLAPHIRFRLPPTFSTLCVVSSSSSPLSKITFLVVAGVCLSVGTTGRPVHLSVAK